MPNLYFDNGCTSFPKPPEVLDYTLRYYNHGGSYGRSAYPRTQESTALTEECRDLLAQKIGIENPDNLAFCSGATQGLNTIIMGMDLKGKDVFVAPMDHNATMRPLKYLQEAVGIKVKMLPHQSDGKINVATIKDHLTDNTGLVVVNYVSNVNGVIQPLGEIKNAIGAVPLLVDGSQAVGHVPVDIDGGNIDMMAFTAHKGLLGPTGLGAFYVRNPELVKPLLRGGTGSLSDSHNMPEFTPDKYQAGTPNVAGIYGLYGALIAEIEPLHTRADYKHLLDEIDAIDGVILLKALDFDDQGEVFSITIDGLVASDISLQLYDRFSIETRAGLHCAPSAHQLLGTYPSGSCRIGVSPYHTPDDFRILEEAIRKISIHA